MPDKTEEQENPEARAEELTDEQLDQTAGGVNLGGALAAGKVISGGIAAGKRAYGK
jgi:hypothetical protein